MNCRFAAHESRDQSGRRVLVCQRCGRPYATSSQFPPEKIHRRCALEPLPDELDSQRQAIVDACVEIAAALNPAAPQRPLWGWWLRQLAARGACDSWRAPCIRTAAEIVASGQWRDSWGVRPDPPRVAILSPTFALGGVERWALDLVGELHARRLAICEMIVLGGQAKTDPRGRAAFGRLAPLVVLDPAALRARLPSYHLAIAWGMIELAALVGDYRPILTCCHGTDRGWSRRYAEACAPISARLVGVSRATRAILADLVPAARLAIVPNGIDARRLSPTAPRDVIRRRLGLGREDFVAGFIGRYSEEKRVLTLCEAVRRARPGVRALVMGDGPLGDAIRSLAADGRIVMLPFGYAIGDALASMDCFVGLSPDEGFWYAGAEAAAVGLPLLSTRVGFLADLAEEIEAGGGPIPWTELARGCTAADVLAGLERVERERPSGEPLARLVARYSVPAMSDGWAGLVSATARLSAAPPAPDVSVLMPVRDTPAAYLAAAWDSLTAQTLSDWELVLVDDGTSRSDTLAQIERIATDPRVRLVRRAEACGISAALNAGLAVCRGPLVARLDSDDLMLPDRLERQLQRLAAEPEIDVLGGQVEVFDDTGKIHQRTKHPAEVDRALVARLIDEGNGVWLLNHPAVTVRRAAIRAIGGYPTEYRRCEDLALWLRALRAGLRIANEPEVRGRYRVHPGQLTADRSDHYQQHDQVLAQEWPTWRAARPAPGNGRWVDPPWSPEVCGWYDIRGYAWAERLVAAGYCLSAVHLDGHRPGQAAAAAEEVERFTAGLPAWTLVLSIGVPIRGVAPGRHVASSSAAVGEPVIPIPYRPDGPRESPPTWSERPVAVSFMGCRDSAPEVRGPAIAAAEKSDRPHALRVNREYYWAYGPVERERLAAEYRQSLAQSRYALCPRGDHPNSVRFFEALAWGCIPILIGDRAALPLAGWLPWDDLCVRVPESAAGDWPALLDAWEAAHPQADGRRGQAIWRQWLAIDALADLLTASGAAS